MGPPWSARMSVHLQSVHFSAEKVVTMLQKRNQVFERVFCADVQAGHAFQLLPLPPPSKRSDGIWKVCFHAASFARGAHIARGDMCMHMHMWAPRGRLMSMCGWICCAGYLSFLVFCSELSRHRRRDARPRRRCSRGLFRVQSSEFILAYALEGHSRGPLSHF